MITLVALLVGLGAQEPVNRSAIITKNSKYPPLSVTDSLL